MVMSHEKTQRLKPLLDQVLPGFIVDTAWLRRQGIDSKSIHDYVARGWLKRIIRGVYRRPLPDKAQQGSEADWQIPLLSIQKIMGYDLHLGGESALDLQGYSHYISLGFHSHVYLYGEAPSWLVRLPIQSKFVVQRRKLFKDHLKGVVDANQDAKGKEEGETEKPPSVNIWRWPLKVSSPERAIMEALDELPKNASFHNLDMIFEGLINLRPKLLTELLIDCRSIKVRRLFFVFADKYEHAWLKHIDKKLIDFGSGPRALVKGGKLHPTYRIYVPAEFIPPYGQENEIDA